MKRAIIIASAALAAGLASMPASAETLNVQGIVAPYCNVNLANVSSGTASIAMANIQTVANLRLACNSATLTRFVLKVQNGDLLNKVGNMEYRINYDLILDSPDKAFEITARDTFPTNGVENSDTFTRTKNGYSSTVSNGIPLQLSLNMNVAMDGNNSATSQQYPANAAPAGTYTEVFTFTASGV